MIEELIGKLRNETYELTSKPQSSRKLNNEEDIRCLLSEEAVLRVLTKYRFVPLTPVSTTSKYNWERNERGIILIKGIYDRPVCEFDEIGTIESTPVTVEIKSTRLNKFSQKIERVRKYGRKAFNREQEPEVLIFLPYQYNEQEQIQQLNKQAHVHCINTRWTKEQFNQYTKKL